MLELKGRLPLPPQVSERLSKVTAVFKILCAPAVTFDIIEQPNCTLETAFTCQTHAESRGHKLPWIPHRGAYLVNIHSMALFSLNEN